MPIKPQAWSVDEANRQLRRRLANARNARRTIESRWEENETSVFNTRGSSTFRQFNVSPLDSDSFSIGENMPEGDTASHGINYTFKNYRYIHSQLSANPPVIAVRPASGDADDRIRAEAGDHLARGITRQYDLPEKVDQWTAIALLYGTGFMKVYWDADKGDIIDLDKDGYVTAEGDICHKPISPWNIFIDPDATTWDEVRFVFERFYMNFEDACATWPEYKDLLEANRLQSGEYADTATDAESALSTPKYDVVELYQYWETGLLINGMLGRFVICTREGQTLGKVEPNPHRFAPPVDKRTGRKSPPTAKLPYIILTDVDVPGQVWGKSYIEYQVVLQNVLNDLDSTTLDNLHAHNVARLVLSDGAEIAKNSISTSPIDVIKVRGGARDPSFVPPMQLPAAAYQHRETMRMGIDDMAGVNEAMFGQQSREVSGSAMQYSTSQGNMIRNRLFKKYTRGVEHIYNHTFNLVRDKWTEARLVTYLGHEMRVQSRYIRGTDIDGGYDIVGEYGTNLSLDPVTRREEIIALMPTLREAGIDPGRIRKMLALNDLYIPTMAELGENRQREIFDEMLKTGIITFPQDWQEHESMLAYSYRFRMTAEFWDLTPEQQSLINKHITLREELAASKTAAAAGAQGMTGGPGGPTPEAGPLPPAAPPGGAAPPMLPM